MVGWHAKNHPWNTWLYARHQETVIKSLLTCRWRPWPFTSPALLSWAAAALFFVLNWAQKDSEQKLHMYEADPFGFSVVYTLITTCLGRLTDSLTAGWTEKSCLYSAVAFSVPPPDPKLTRSYVTSISQNLLMYERALPALSLACIVTLCLL